MASSSRPFLSADAGRSISQPKESVVAQLRERWRDAMSQSRGTQTAWATGRTSHAKLGVDVGHRVQKKYFSPLLGRIERTESWQFAGTFAAPSPTMKRPPNPKARRP
jgi:hypothetical protein